MSLDVHYSHGSFLIYNPDHALQLRKRFRILSLPVAQIPAAGPHHLSAYAAQLVLSKQLATFKRLKRSQVTDPEKNKSLYEIEQAKMIEKEREFFESQRLAELERHNVAVSDRTMKAFDDSKIRLDLNHVPDVKLSNYETEILSSEEVTQILQSDMDKALALIYQDLYDNGLYISSGMKFGCDFLAYIGDPVLYHAQYAVRLVPSDPSGMVDLDKISFPEINSLQRLTHTAKKTPVFATVTTNSDGIIDLKYWTISERVYLNADSTNSEFSRIRPSASFPILSQPENNKFRRMG